MAPHLNIIVVEDHDLLREVTVKALAGLGHHVIGVDCAESLTDEHVTNAFDLLVLDLNLPGEDGISLASRIRETQPNVGIIMVTARQHINDKLLGYETGADIYLTKPTSIEELAAAVQALAKRLNRRIESVSTPYQLDLASLALQGPLNRIQLSSNEVSMLVAFARAPEHRLEYWQMIELSGHLDTEFAKNTLEVQVGRLRKKLVQAGAFDQPIKAIRGVGYQLCIPITLF